MEGERHMATVFDVAEYILQKLGEVTTMKLQKLVYYCQAWSLVWDEQPLFEDDFQAWANGPVCPALFDKHRGKFVISAEDIAPFTTDCKFSDAPIETMDAVIRDYGSKDPQWLIDLTHSELPWQSARGTCSPGDRCDTVIPKESMQQYYAGIYHG